MDLFFFFLANSSGEMIFKKIKINQIHIRCDFFTTLSLSQSNTIPNTSVFWSVHEFSGHSMYSRKHKHILTLKKQ